SWKTHRRDSLHTSSRRAVRQSSSTGAEPLRTLSLRLFEAVSDRLRSRKNSPHSVLPYPPRYLAPPLPQRGPTLPPEECRMRPAHRPFVRSCRKSSDPLLKILSRSLCVREVINCL